MPRIRERIRSVMRSIMRWKVIFDLITLVVAILLVLSYWMSDRVSVSEQLIGYWFWLLAIFVGAREAGRWIGDHKSGTYMLSMISKGEIYLILFILLPVVHWTYDAFQTNAASAKQVEALSMMTALGIKVTILYVVTSISKGLTRGNKEIVTKLSDLLNAALGGKPSDTDP